MVWTHVKNCPLTDAPVPLKECLRCGDDRKARECPVQAIRRSFYVRGYSPGVYHVSNLWKIRQAFFERFVDYAQTWSRVMDLYVGSAIHQYVQDKRFTYALSEVSLRRLYRFGGDTVFLVGHVDAVDVEKKTVYEFKSAWTLNPLIKEGAAKPEHVYQIQTYYSLARNLGLPVEKLLIVYIAKTPKSIKRYLEFAAPGDFELEEPPDLEERVRTLHYAVKHGVPPSTPECPSWLCRYCPEEIRRRCLKK